MKPRLPRPAAAPRSSKDLMAKLVKDLKKSLSSDQWYTHIEWDRYLDPEWSAAITGVRYDKQTLILSANSSIFSHHFQHVKTQILNQLRDHYPDKPIKDLRCKVGK